MHRTIAASLVERRVEAAVLVPTAAAGTALRRTLQGSGSNNATILTRDDLYARLHDSHARSIAPGPTDSNRAVAPMLSAFEREVLLSKAAERARASGAPPPFRLRPGLIVEILGFYDELRRRDRTVADFDRLMTDSLRSSIEIDRGAERLYRQTLFLAATFSAFEDLVRASGRPDEHAVRSGLLAAEIAPPFRHLVLAIADQAADPRGLWTADYDLLARLHGVDAIDVVATENVLASGFHQRVHDVLPGIEEVRLSTPSPPPVLVAPQRPSGENPVNWFVHRDREQELSDVARRASALDDPERQAVVFQRPLPYLYLAPSVFADAGQRYQTVDALPLAAEPFAAAIDLVFSFLSAEANRSSIVHLLSSPHWRFTEMENGVGSPGEQVAALDAFLREQKYLGGWDRLAAVAEQIAPDAASAPSVSGRNSRRRSRNALASPAIRAAVGAAQALAPIRNAAAASAQFQTLLAFIRNHERPAEPSSSWSERHLRTRGAVMDALESLAAACERHDDAPMAIERLTGAVRRWIDGQTFAPALRDGVLLLDASAAAFADVDHLRFVGLVESDWPERARRSIFYPSNLLSQLGWPNESDRLAAARARFHDLLRLPQHRVSVSTFTLEDDAIVAASSLLEEIDASGLAVERVDDDVAALSLFTHESLLSGQAGEGVVTGDARTWLALRASRSPSESASFHGSAGAREPAVYAVSHVERYLECPFKYFAARVLQLDEEREDESGLSPQERGQLLHEVFETFFRRWHEAGRRAVTTANLADALDLFASVAEAVLERLPEVDRALERTYLLGSAAAAGLGERAFNFEIEQDCEVVERLLEHPLEGEFEFAGADGPRRIRIRAKTDRIDLLDDGSMRVIDYKLGRAPKPARALQLPVYGLCAEQHLAGHLGRDWKVSRAGYVAFKEKNAFVNVGGSTSLERALDEGAKRLVAAVDSIERGDFPVKPEEPYRCIWCGYAGVCRKDYVGDE